MSKYLVVFGTRPEAIKMAPVLQALGNDPQNVCVTCSTGQHQELLTQVLSLFRIKPDHELMVMSPNQQLAGLTSLLLTSIDQVIRAERPDRVLVQGDTTTAMVAAMAACYSRVPVAHIEAGVRSNNPSEPFPEEVNRKIIDVVSDVFFAPTAVERHHLICERVCSDQIYVTGNTSIDALCHVASLPFSMKGSVLEKLPIGKKKILLATVHRRESHGTPLKKICDAIRVIARRYKESVHIVIPVHPNPNVTASVHRALGGISNVTLTAPLGYQELIAVAKISHFALTDSGGLQEELTWLGKPALVLRNVTDRQEAVDAGAAILVGVEPQVIVAAATELMENPALYARMAQPRSLYGDGMAAHRIANILQSRHVAAFDRRSSTIDIPPASIRTAA